MVPRDGVLIVDADVARDLAKGLALLDDERRRNGWGNGAELGELQHALAALATGASADFRYGFRSEGPRASSGAGWVTVAVAARMLDRTERRTRQLCEAEVLVAHRAGRRWLIDEESVMARAKERAA